MKIKKTPPKRLAPANAAVQSVVNSLVECPESAIASTINAFGSEWPWPRGDLFHWIPVLNRLDNVLGHVCTRAGFTGTTEFQKQNLSSNDKDILVATLKFERLLLENCTNRNIYNSYEHLDHLMMARDLDILDATLRLILRPAQRLNTQRTIRSHFSVSRDNILTLAQTWNSKEHGIGLLQLISEDFKPSEDLTTLNYKFFRTVNVDGDTVSRTETATTQTHQVPSSAMPPSTPVSKAKHVTPPTPSTPATPGPSTLATTSKPTEGMTAIVFPCSATNGRNDAQIHADLVEQNQVPPDYRFPLYCKLRVSMGMANLKTRRQLLVIRLLAIAIMAHYLPEHKALSKVFLFEQDLISNLAELVNPDSNVPFEIQTAAFYALDGITRYRSKLTETLSALNASANHGILLYALRRVVLGLNSDTIPYPQEFLESLFAFIQYIVTTQSGGNMVISAGLIPLLIPLLENTRDSCSKIITKAVILLDSVVYGFSNSFTPFIEARGVDILVQRIKQEVDRCMDLAAAAQKENTTEQGDSGDLMEDVKQTSEKAETGALPLVSSRSHEGDDTPMIPHEKVALLKSMLKFVLHMMQTTGTAGGLRNLIESSIPASLKRILESRVVFGNSVYGLAINVMATFIHNEPTSLPILQEAQLPETFLKSVATELPTSVDVISAIPNAFGAICLNASGLEAFIATNPLENFFSIFTSHKHLRTLQDGDVAAMLGGQVDELVRHHPSLKESVFKSISTMFEGVAKMGEAETLEGDEELVGHHLHAAKGDGTVEEKLDNSKHSVVYQFIEIAARFLEGLFQNTSHCKDFCTQVTLEPLLRLHRLPRLTYEYTITSASFTLNHVIRVISEVEPAEVVKAVLKEFVSAFDEARPYFDTEAPYSLFADLSNLTEADPTKIAKANHAFRLFITISGITSLLSDIYLAPAFSHNKSFPALVQAFVTSDSVIPALGQLHRACIWESKALKAMLPEPKEDVRSSKRKNSTATVASLPSTGPIAVTEGSDVTPGPATGEVMLEDEHHVQKNTMKSPEVINMTYFKTLAHQTASYVHPILQGLTKLFPTTRRTMDANSRKLAINLADAIAAELCRHLTWSRLGGEMTRIKVEFLLWTFRVMSSLFLEERNHHPFQTVLIVAFDRMNGMTHVFDTLNLLWAEAGRLNQQLELTTAENETKTIKEALKLVNDALDLILGILQLLVTSKHLHDSPQTALMTGKEKDRSSSDFFDAHEWLVDIRMKILPVVIELWRSDVIRSCPTSVVRHVVQILVHIMKGEGEVSTRGIAAGLEIPLFSHAAAHLFAPPRPPVVADEERIQQLVDMGFPRPAAEVALVRTHNNIGRAAEYLITHPEAITAATAASAASSQGNTGSNPNPTAAASTDAAPNGNTPTETQPAAAEGSSSQSASSAPVEPAAESSTTVEEASVAPMETGEESSTRVESEPGSSEQPGQSASSSTESESSDPKAAEKPSERDPAILERYTELKADLKKDVIQQCTSLPDYVEDVMFDLKSLIMVSAKDRVDEIAAFLCSEVARCKEEKNEKHLANRMRLFALLLNEQSIEATLLGKSADFAPKVLDMVAEQSDMATSSGAISDWVASALLLIEAYISHTDEPQTADPTWKKEGDKAGDMNKKAEDKKEEYITPSQRSRLVKNCISLLKNGKSNRNTLLSVLRIVVRITRLHTYAVEFAKGGGVSTLFEPLKKGAEEFQGQQALIIMILRHVMEDSIILKQTMENEIVNWFSTTRPRIVDVNAYIRNNSPTALRSPETFVEATQNVCRLVRYEPNSRSHQIVLKQDDKVEEPKQDTPIEGGEEVGESAPVDPMAVNAVTAASSSGSLVEAYTTTKNAYVSEVSESLTAFLISELLATKTADAVSTTPISGATSSGDVVKTVEAETVKGEDQLSSSSSPSPPSTAQDATYIYRCFILQCMAELLASYPSVKLDMLAQSKKRTGKEPHTPSRSRSTFIQYILHGLLPYSSTGALVTPEQKKRHAQSTKAAAVLIALCSGNGTDTEDKEKAKEKGKEKKEKTVEVSDLVHVRKSVLDCIARAFKDAIASSEPVETKYGRFIALCDLCYHILTVKPPVGGTGAKIADDVTSSVAKLMLEKNFVSTFTTVLAEVDLNFPQVHNVVGVILRPLEYLTKVATKMGKAGETISTGKNVRRRLGEELSRARETPRAPEDETPDLYRNSALGIFEGGGSMETDDDAGSSEEDDGYDDDGYADETDSDLSDVDEDEGDGMELVVEEDDHHYDDLDEEHEEGEDSEMSDEDDDDDEDGDGDEDDDGDEIDDELMEIEEHIDDHDEESEDGGEDMQWQMDEHDHGHMMAAEDIQEVYAEEDGGDHGRRHGHGMDVADGYHNGAAGLDVDHGTEIDDGDEDEDEDGEDYPDEFPDGEVFDPQVPSGFEDDLRRIWGHGGDGAFVIEGVPAQGDNRTGRSIARPSAETNDDVVMHPLLVNRQPIPPVQPPAEGPSARIPRNAIGSGVDWNTFGELIGGNAVHILEQLLNSNRQGGPSGYRLEVSNPSGGGLVANAGVAADRVSSGLLGEQVGQASSMQQDPLNIVKGFNAMTTSERWHQECRLMYGNGMAEKASRLVNAVMNELVPTALEEAKQKKEKEDRERQEAELKAREQAKKEEDEAAEQEKKRAEEQKIIDEARASESVVPVTTDEAVPAVDAAEDMEVEPLVTDVPPEPVAEAESSEAPERPAEASSSAPAEAAMESAQSARTIVTINGREVDVTDMGIDVTFLEALPEDMRQDVITQHLREQGRAVPPPAPTGISDEFLDALPDEIRAEVLAQERIEARRQLLQAQRQQASLQVAAEMDNASFLASLDPDLRGAILMEQDEEFLAELPPNLVAEANTLRERHQRRLANVVRINRPRMTAPASGSDSLSAMTPKKLQMHREAIQLVDRPGLATLVRLLFLPQGSGKAIMHKLLLNLCENSKSRSELLSLLLSIIQDGGADLAAVDKSFAQMSLRGKTHATPSKATPGKRLTTKDQDQNTVGEGIPNLVAQRCLEAIAHIVTHNEQSVQYFLTENENVALRKPGTKKGKGKEKAVAVNKYPIVVLLSLLERSAFLENLALMDQLMHLLATICRPLSSFGKKQDEKKQADEATQSTTPATASTNSDSPSTGSGLDQPPSGANTTENNVDLPAENTNTLPHAESDTSVGNLPVIPENCLRSIVNVLTEGECSSKTFQYTLAVIQHLSALPGAKDVITAELVKRAQSLGDSVRTSLQGLHKVLSDAMTGIDVQGATLNKFTPASSDQAKLLRVLKTIDYMYSHKPGTAATLSLPRTTPATVPVAATSVEQQPTAVEGDGVQNQKLLDEQKASFIYETLNFYSLWQRLGDCLMVIHEKEDTMHVATVLLPIMESFMVMHKHISFKNAAAMQRNASRINLLGKEGSASPQPLAEPKSEELFFQFTEDHRKILNAMVRKNPSLMSGSFSLLVHNPKVLEFENKRNYFNQQLHKRSANREHFGPLQLNVRRQFVFEDSFHQLQGRTGDEVKYGKLSVRFYDEEGVDAGGVSREWFQVLARQMFNPDYALFHSSAVKKVTYQPNRFSHINPEHLLYFRFVGRVVGKAIFDGKLLDCYFTRSLYKHILGKPVDYRDVEALDPAYYQSLEWMSNNDITDVIDLTMSIEADEFGKQKIIELVPDGENIPVTEENKKEYIRLVSEQKLTTAIKDQIAAFKDGFHEVIPRELVSIFDPEQLELMISGMPDINVEDWKANTEYQGYTASSPQVQWFWRAVRSFETEERAKLLQFVTGTSRVPLEGFSSLQGMNGIQKFSIRMDPSSATRLPSAHTCFNSMDLPEYESYEQLRKQLLMAITEASFGFGFA